MKISNIKHSNSPVFMNLSYAKQCGLRSMQQITGIEKEIIEAYKKELPHNIWGNAEKLKEWALNKIENIVTKEYPSKLLDSITIREGRTDAVEKWYQFVKTNYNTKDNPFLQLKILKFVTKNLHDNNKQLAPILNTKVAADAAYESNRTNSSFKKTYYKLMREFDTSFNVKTENVSENGITGKWYSVTVPETAEAKKSTGKFNKIRDYIAILSQGTNWCTRSPHTVGHEFSGSHFNIFIDNKGIPQLCLTRLGKSKNWFKYIRGNNQYLPIKEKFKCILKSFLKKHHIENATYGDLENNKPVTSLFT